MGHLDCLIHHFSENGLPRLISDATSVDILEISMAGNAFHPPTFYVLQITLIECTSYSKNSTHTSIAALQLNCNLQAIIHNKSHTREIVHK